jgi:competence protein ComEC
MSAPREPRPLLLPAIGLVLGVALGAGLPSGLDLPLFGLGLAALAAALAVGRGAGRLLVAVGFACLGLARGLPPPGDPPPIDSPDAPLWQVTVLRGVDEPDAMAIPIRLEAARRGPAGPVLWRGRASAQLRIGAWPDRTTARRGERWLLRGRLRSPMRGAGPPTLFVARPGEALRLETTTRPHHRLVGWGDRPLERARRRVRLAIDQASPGPSHGLLLALALGDRRELAPELREAFARTGTAHLLAISGMHVGCFAGVLYLVVRPGLRSLPLPLDLRQAAVPDRVALLVALVGAAAYVVLAGAPVSGRRALVMLACVTAGGLIDRRAGGWNALAAAALLVAWTDPASVRAVGFQLSVASVAGLVATIPSESESAPGRLRRWARLPLRAAAASLVATVATAPLCALTWGRVPVAGLWVNLAAIPILGALTVPPLLVGAALGAVHPVLGAPAIRFASATSDLGCRLVLWCSEPGRCPVLHWEPGPWTVPTLYAVALPLMLAADRRRPGRAP